MNANVSITALAAICLVAACGTVQHTPPGTSVEVALAKKGELVKLPTPPPAPATPAASTAHVPAVESTLPVRNDLAEKVAEAYSRGVFCLQAEKDAEALEAFEEAARLDPTFTDAWEKLAAIYERAGDTKKAMEAFNKAKKFARK